MERNRDQKQRTGKPPFESERHTKAFRVRIGSAKVLQTFPGFTSFFAAVVFLHHQNKGNVDSPFGTLRCHFSPGKVNKYFVS